MNLKQLYLTENDCYKAGRTITPKGIMVHSTGANNPNLRRYVGPDDGLLGENTNNNHWNRSGLSVCVHAFIGKLAGGGIATYQTLPWNWRGWHCGGAGNNTHISFEICEDGRSDAAYFGKVYQEAVELCAYLCDKYGLNPTADGVLICHSEGYSRRIASNHADVMHWFPEHGKSMDTFRADVKSAMDGGVAIPTGGTLSNGTAAAPVSEASLKKTGIEKFQAWLNTFGDYRLAIDGIYGPKTRTAAIKAMQRLVGVTADGIWGAKSRAACPVLKKDATGNRVYVLQGMLYCRSYVYTGFSGRYSDATVSEVRSFQKGGGLTIDGLAGKTTFTKLFA